MNREFNAILTIAARDFIKLLRDRARIISSLIFPLIFLGALGGSAQANIGPALGINMLVFTFTGVYAQVLFQSTAAGISFLIQDRENDFSQEIFVSPISRYSIILGKILGESLVALVQVVGVVIFAFAMGIPISPRDLLLLIPAAVVACLLGGAFGTLILSQLGNLRSAQQVFPFFIFPQFFLSGVFVPIKELPPVLFVLSRIAPLTYAVDFTRGIIYWGKPEYDKVVLYHPLVNLAIIATLFTIMLVIGTYFFVKSERNR